MGPIDWIALSPELIVAGGILVVLSLDLFLPQTDKYWLGVVSVMFLSAAVVPLLWMATESGSRSVFDGSFVVDDFALVLKGLFLVAGYLVMLLSVSYIESDRYYQGEYYLLLLISILGSMVLASARDLLLVFIGLELTTAPLFLLAGWRKGDARSNEAALKFFVLGVLSTAFLLWGMSMVYGITGAIRFDDIRLALSSVDVERPVLVIALWVMLVGFGFKISAVPFHFWVPDTYQGAPTPVTAYLSVSSKAAGLVALLAMVYLAFPDLDTVWGPGLWLVAAASMTVGNLSALRQTNLIRLLGYSSIAQAGFMLVPFAGAAASGDNMAEGLSATVTYLLIYAVMNLGAFAVLIAGARRTGTAEIAGWAGFGSYAPRQGVLLSIFFLSLAGIPPLAGWFAKFAMFRSVMTAGGDAAIWLAIIAALNSVVAFYYYAKVVKTVWMDSVPDELQSQVGQEERVPGSLRLAMGLSALAVVLVGIFPGLSTFFSEATTRVLAGG